MFKPINETGNQRSLTRIRPPNNAEGRVGVEQKEKINERIPPRGVLVGFHAPRLLLFMEAGPGLAASGFGRPYRCGLLFYSTDSGLFHPLEERPALQLDVPLFRNIHPSLWQHTPYGSVDALARDLLALGRDQSFNGSGLRPDGDTASLLGPSRRGTTQPTSNEARNRGTQIRRAGAKSGEGTARIHGSRADSRTQQNQ